MRRNTLMVLYKTGRIDATFQNIWAFENKQDRNTWLMTKSPVYFEHCKFWKYGETVKLQVPFDESFEYDYIQIVNEHETANQKTFYCFITGRTYINDNLTAFNVDIDIVQTWYFDSDGSPCWYKNAFIAKSTSPIQPPRGTATDFPTVEPICANFISAPADYAVAIYSAVNLIDLDNPSYTSGIVNSIFTSSPPYVMNMNSSALTTLLNKVNQKGFTDAISGIYLFPKAYCDASFLTDSPQLPTQSFFTTYDFYITRPTSCDGYVPVNNVLLGYDYTYFTINNGSGEVVKYNFEDFNGTPHFEARITLGDGSPTLLCYPVNYISNATGVNRQMAQKNTVSVFCTYLNDSYRIWLAQTQNSRQAALNQAAESIRQAEYARDHAYAPTLKEAITPAEENARSFLDSIGSGIRKGLDTAYEKLGISQFMKPVSETPTKTTSDIVDVAFAWGNKQLGLDAAYQYDFNVKNAELAQDALLASYRDKAAVPAQAVGSNAYGNVTALAQYGFMFAVFTPTAEYASWIDKTLSAGGHTVNKYGLIARDHKIFDFYRCTSVQLFSDAARPEFARYHIISTLNKGVYLWYYADGDISPAIGVPYNLENEVVN